MNKSIIFAGLLAASLALPLAGCGGSGDRPQAGSGTSTTAQTTSSSNGGASGSKSEASEKYVGQWRGSVKITGQTVYGNAGGTEQMLDVNLASDGTCTVVPLEAHADLLKASGTWEATDDGVVLHLDSKEIALKKAGKNVLQGDAADFGISDFETIDFDFYG